MDACMHSMLNYFVVLFTHSCVVSRELPLSYANEQMLARLKNNHCIYTNINNHVHIHCL